MSTFAGRPRKGCLACGKFTMALDDTRAAMRHASNRYAKNPTATNRAKAEKAKQFLDEAKKFHDEHMAQHDEGTSDDSPRTP